MAPTHWWTASRITSYNVCYTKLLRTTIVAANLAYSTVVFASLFGVALWDEVLSPLALLGMLLIISSGILVSLARHAATRPAHAN